jgi:hypothetical protein
MFQDFAITVKERLRKPISFLFQALCKHLLHREVVKLIQSGTIQTSVWIAPNSIDQAAAWNTLRYHFSLLVAQTIPVPT